MRIRLASLVLMVLVAGCGSSAQKPKDGGPSDAKDAMGGDTGVDKPAGDAPAATDGGEVGETAPASDASDGPSCDAACAGVCVEGKCLEEITVAQDTDLSKTPVFDGRTCAAAPQYAVTALTATVATLAEAPAGDCLAKGDEVLLIDMQGTPLDSGRVGLWELLRVASVAGNAVTFTTSHTREYGVIAQVATDGGTDAAANEAGGAADDGGAGDAAASEAGVALPAVGPQKIMLARVPRFGDLKVLSGSTLKAAPWNGTTGGVLTLRAASLRVDGDINAGTLGYRQGRWSQDGICSDNIVTEAGESISGPGSSSTNRNIGGSGGIAAASGILFNNSTPICASPGHATAGEPGSNPNGRTLGQPGATYGIGDGTLLTMGSGPGGNLTCEVAVQAAHLVDQPGRAGGIIALFVDTLTLGPEGVVSASAPAQSRDVAFAGGFVFIRGGKLDVGTARVTAKGSRAISGSPPSANMVNKAGDGYVTLDATGTITGTTDPAANVVPH